MINFRDIALNVEEIAHEAGDMILQMGKSITQADVEIKGLHNYVTRVDKEAERLIISRLKGIVADAGFIAEEGTEVHTGERYNWVIDPLDGTTNFIHGVPISSVSIALMEGDKTVVGSVYEIHSRESFLAYHEGPALLNGSPIRVSERNNINETLLATGFPYYDYNLLDPYLDLFRHFMKTTRGLRRLGSAAVDLAWVACGRFDAFYEYGLNPWDVAAGAFIVDRAGGSNSDFGGGPGYIFGKQILSSNKILHHEYIRQIQMFFGKNESII